MFLGIIVSKYSKDSAFNNPYPCSSHPCYTCIPGWLKIRLLIYSNKNFDQWTTSFMNWSNPYIEWIRSIYLYIHIYIWKDNGTGSRMGVSWVKYVLRSGRRRTTNLSFPDLRDQFDLYTMLYVVRAMKSICIHDMNRSIDPI